MLAGWDVQRTHETKRRTFSGAVIGEQVHAGLVKQSMTINEQKERIVARLAQGGQTVEMMSSVLPPLVRPLQSIL